MAVSGRPLLLTSEPLQTFGATDEHEGRRTEDAGARADVPSADWLLEHDGLAGEALEGVFGS